MKYEDCKLFCEQGGYTSRASRYKIMEDYFGISAGTIKEIMSFDRYLRDIFPIDEVGIEKEAQYHHSKSLWDFENETKKVSKRLEKDKLLFG